MGRGACYLLALSMIQAAWCDSYPVRDITRDSLCLPPALRSNFTNRTLVYPDKSVHPVRVPYQGWPSAHIIGHIAYILVKEVMGYSSVLFDTTTIMSENVVNYAAGCLDPDDANCTEANILRPRVHFTLEVWEGGRQRAMGLHEDVRPDLISVLSYNLVDQWYIWQHEIDAGLDARPPLSLDYFRSYDARRFEPQRQFDTWEQLLSRLPDGIVGRCSAMSSYDRNTDLYTSVTGDAHVECHLDRVWISPACRGPNNVSECVPLLLPYNFDIAMQLAFFLDIPLAIVQAIGDGFFPTVNSSRILFGWYQPSDDPISDEQGRFPVMVNLPPRNTREQAEGVYKTGFAQFKPYNFGWRSLRDVDRLVHFFAAKVDLGDDDWDHLLPVNRRLKASGLTDDESSWQVACAWVLENEERWRPWIPAVCPAGQMADSSLGSCKNCPAGSYCEGGPAVAQPCPVGAFHCPPRSSSPIPCPAGWTVPAANAASSCSECAPGYLGVSWPQANCYSAMALSLGCAVVAGAALIVLSLAVKLALHMWVSRSGSRGGGNEEERRLRNAVEEARERLHLRRRDGFYLSSETPPAAWLAPWRAARSSLARCVAGCARLIGGESAVKMLGRWVEPFPRKWRMLPRAQAEAAARMLVLREEVDVHVFDALVVFLVGHEKDEQNSSMGSGFSGAFRANPLAWLSTEENLFESFCEYQASRNTLAGPSLSRPLSGVPESDEFGPGAAVENWRGRWRANPRRSSRRNSRLNTKGDGDRLGAVQYMELCRWMVELARDLLDPRKVGTISVAHQDSTLRSARTHLPAPRSRTPEPPDVSTEGFLGFEACSVSERRGSADDAPGVTNDPSKKVELGRARRNSLAGALASALPSSLRSRLTDGEDSSMLPNSLVTDLEPISDEDGRFRYLTGTLCRARLWHYHGGALFDALQREVQVLVREAAIACDRRFAWLQKEPGGLRLVLSQWCQGEDGEALPTSIPVQRCQSVVTLPVRKIIKVARWLQRTASKSEEFDPPEREKTVRSTEGLEGRCRQDDPSVGAIRVYAVDLLEAGAPMSMAQDSAAIDKQPPDLAHSPNRLAPSSLNRSQSIVVPRLDMEPVNMGPVEKVDTAGIVPRDCALSISLQPALSNLKIPQFEPRQPAEVFSCQTDSSNGSPVSACLAPLADRKESSGGGTGRRELSEAVPVLMPESNPGQQHSSRCEPSVDSASSSRHPIDSRPLKSMLRPRAGIADDEEIFVQQLYRRARLLNRAFQRRIVQAVRRHAEPPPGEGARNFRASQDTVVSAVAQRRQRRKGISSHVVNCLFSGGKARSFESQCGDSENGSFASRGFDATYTSPVEIVFAPVKSLSRMREKVKEYEAPDAVWPLAANILDPVRISLVCEGPLEILEVIRWFEDDEGEELTSAAADATVSSNGLRPAIRPPVGTANPQAPSDSCEPIRHELPADFDDSSAGGAGTDWDDGFSRTRSIVSRCESAPRTPLPVLHIKNRFALPREEIPDGYRDVKLFVRFTDGVSGLSIIGEIQVHDRALHEIKLQMHKLYKVARAKSADMIA